MRNLILAILLSIGFHGYALSAAPSPPAAGSIPSRTTCTAPCAIFFDASGTTGGGTVPFTDNSYRWIFGNSSAATFSYGANVGQSSNFMTGPVVAHVYETAGAYVWELSVSDGTNAPVLRSGTVTVSAADTTFASSTVCIAASGSVFTGCPDGAATVTNSDFDAEIATQIAAGKRRILYKRGNTFTASASSSIVVDGPFQIGAFGSGDRPKILGPNDAVITLSSSATPTVNDFIISDIEIDGQSNAASVGVRGGSSFSQLTIFNAYFHHIHTGLELSTGTLDLQNAAAPFTYPVWSEVYVFNSTISSVIGGSGGYGIFMACTSCAIVNTSVTDAASGEHNVRITYAQKMSIYGNTFSESASTKHTLTIRGAPWGGTDTYPANTYTQDIYVGRNRFIGAAGVDWTVTIGTTGGGADNRHQLHLWDGNWFEAGAGTQVALRMSSVKDSAFRNNIVNTSGGSAHIGFGVDSADTMTTDNNAFYNNTIFSSDTDNDFYAFDVGSTAAPTNTTIKNNLAYAPNDSTHAITRLQNGSTVTASNNSNTTTSGGNGVLVDPLFASATPSNPIDFRIGTGSYADTGGTAAFPASVYDFGNCTNGANIPIGAWHPKNSVCVGAAKGETP